MLKFGVECENLEDVKSRWGVGQITLNLLEQYAANPEWQKKYKLFLYFKREIPDDAVLKNPVFIKRILRTSSFNIFYHILLPIRAMIDRLDWMFFPAYMLPPLYLGKSIVLLTDDVYYEYTQGTLPFKYKLAYRLFTNWAAKRARKILAISNASRKELVKLYGIAPKRIFVSRLGVGPKNSTTHNPQSATLSYILYIGQMFPRRCVKESVLAFKKIAPEFPELKFILVGKDRYNPPVIKKMIVDTNQELGSERILQYDYIDKREDIEKLYAGAKLFIYVSHSEAFGLPPVEAASYSVPVVVEDSDLNHELFGDAAFFVRSSNADHIAIAIQRGLTDMQKREYCIKKYKEIIPRLSWRNFAEKFFNILD